MSRQPLLIILVVALLGSASCTTERVHNNSGNAGATPGPGVTRSTTPSPAAAVTPAPRPPAAADSTSPPSRSKVIQITDGNYAGEVLRSQLPVLIHFGAPWSGPDRMIAPTIESVAKEYEGRVKVGEVNVDENAGLAEKFGIQGIPTLVVMKSGDERERVVGATSREAIRRLLDKQLGGSQ